MNKLKFRTPVQCQNGHKGLWYWHVEDYGIGTVKHLGVVSNRCDCAKQALGEGYVKDGDDQQFIGKLDKNSKEIYSGDIVRLKWQEHVWGIYTVEFGEGANEGGGDSSSYFYGYYLKEVNGEKQHADYLIEDDLAIEVIGNITENRELLEKVAK
jgi:uncharacterized phage protein (TIGR01671 family)